MPCAEGVWVGRDREGWWVGTVGIGWLLNLAFALHLLWYCMSIRFIAPVPTFGLYGLGSVDGYSDGCLDGMLVIPHA